MFFAPSPPLPPSPLPSTSSFRPKLLPTVASAACAVKTSSYSFKSAKLASLPSSASTFYEVLGISMGASGEEIRAAYRKLARVCHPDVVSIDGKYTSAEEFMRIHAAYSTLSDPAKRSDYDRTLFRRHRSFGSYSVLSSTAGLSSFNRYSGRNWETDQCW